MSHAEPFPWAPRTERQLVGFGGLLVYPIFVFVPVVLAGQLEQPLIAAAAIPFAALTVMSGYMFHTPEKGLEEGEQ